MRFCFSFSSCCICLALSTALTGPAAAVDTEIYEGSAIQHKPNVLFILDTSGSMVWGTSQNTHPNQGEQTRMEILQDILRNQLLPQLSNVNIGLMRFENSRNNSNENDPVYNQMTADHGGVVLYPISDIDSPGTLSALQNTVDQLSPNGATPLTETLYEAFLYYAGAPVWFGMGGYANAELAYYFPNIDDQPLYSHPSSIVGNSSLRSSSAYPAALATEPPFNTIPRYQSPILSSCQKNFIIYMTDGKPTYDHEANVAIQLLQEYGDTLAPGQLPLDILSSSQLSALKQEYIYSTEAQYLANPLQLPLGDIDLANSSVIHPGFLPPRTFDYYHAAMQRAGGTNDSHSQLLRQASPPKLCSRNPFNYLEAVDEHGSANAYSCMDELADVMHSKYDFFDEGSGALETRQNITISTVAFALNGSRELDLLRETALKGGGTMYHPTTAAQLLAAFQDALTMALDNSVSTFSTPSLSIDASSGIYHDEMLFFPLFVPSNSVHLDGNLKKLRLDTQPSANGAPQIRILDTQNQLALDSNGQFRPQMQSFWSSAADGDNFLHGGALEKLQQRTADSRSIYTDLTINNGALEPFSTANNDLLAVMTQVLGSNSAASDAINFMRGSDVFDSDGDGNHSEMRSQGSVLGAPLHSEPLIVRYKLGSGRVVPVVFFGTTDGLLHAIDGETGNEIFAFLPERALPQIPLLTGQQNLPQNSERPHGLDGNPVLWIEDHDNDGLITSGIDSAYLYFGMRRGGRNYYALDISHHSIPQLKWRIDGGIGDFNRLGQTWSTPQVGAIKIGGVARQVLIFSGGYDPDQDNHTQRKPDGDDIGAAIYIVDALSGERLWWGGRKVGNKRPDLIISQMKFSIPATVTALRMSGPFIDRLYIGDAGGQVFRFDIDNNSQSASVAITGGLIADIGDNSSIQDSRRIYNVIDAAIVPPRPGQQGHLALVFGSGYRAHPRNQDIADRIYLLRDPFIYGPPRDNNGQLATTPSDYWSLYGINEGHLYDATTNLIQQGNDTEKNSAQTDLASKKGWFIRLETAGEKVLSDALIVQGVIYITTFLSGNASLCSPDLGASRAYRLSLFDGSAAFDENNDRILSRNDRLRNLALPGLPPMPRLLHGQTRSAVLAGSSVIDTDIQQRRRAFWYDKVH